jgi:hypothetical protein
MEHRILKMCVENMTNIDIKIWFCWLIDLNDCEMFIIRIRGLSFAKSFLFIVSYNTQF